MSSEINRRDALIAHVRAHNSLRGQVVQELDLRGDAELLRSISGAEAAFLGCTLDPEVVVHLYQTGADLFPPLSSELPFRPYRNGLYTVDELYEGFDPAVPGSFYAEVARMARGLARAGYLVATGGGPGAMEAANTTTTRLIRACGGAALGVRTAPYMGHVIASN